MHFLLSWLILAVSVWTASAVVPGVRVKSFGSSIWVAAIIGVLNLLLGWVFYTVFAVLTLGLAVLLSFITRWIIDAIILSIAGKVSDAFDVDDFKSALFGAGVIALVGTLLQHLLLR